MLYLSQLVGRPILDVQGERIGKIADLIVALGDRYPPVTGLVAQTGRPRIFLHWSAVASLDATGARLATSKIDIGHFVQRPNEILLRADLLDRQIVDIDDRKVVRVNDLRLDEIAGSLHLVAVDVGVSGLLRRLGLEGPFRTIARNRAVPGFDRFIDWEDVDPVESSVASVRLRVPHARLAALHPADLAQILDQLAPRDRAGVLATLGDEAVADAMEEMEPENQVDVLEDLEPERAADILEEMSPDDAADLVADLSEESRQEILALMERDEADEVRELLGYPEDSAGGIMTTEYIALPESITAAGAIDRLRELEPDAETVYYLYVTDDEERLVGVLSLRDLIVAPPDRRVGEFMHRDPIAVDLLTPQEQVAEVIAHYDLLAVPVVSAEGRLEGIVTVDDAIDTVIPTAWKKRLPRVFSR